MKIEEEIAKAYFKFLGYEDIVYEPNGNRTPDFLVNGEIAIEVRRLNQFYKQKPLENVWYNISPKIIKVIESFKKENYVKSFFVGIKFKRPIKLNSSILNHIDKVLTNHPETREDQVRYFISENLQLSLFPCEKRYETPYLLGSITDYDEGGFVFGNIYNSLKIIISLKSEIVEPYKSEYSTWWLALVDNIGQGLSKDEMKQLKRSIDFDLKFDRVYIISNLRNNQGGYIENCTGS